MVFPGDDSMPVLETDIPEQKVFDNQPFPLVLSPGLKEWEFTKWIHWFQNNTSFIQKLLSQYGAILFRGFPVHSPEDFDSMVGAFGFKDFPYIGGAAPRKQVTGRVFTSNEAPPSELIPFHHEMAQSPKYPKKLFFYCDVEPPRGGETPILLSHLVYQEMKQRCPDFVAALEQKGIKYTRIMPEEDDPSTPIGRGWRSTYAVNSREELEKRCHELGSELEWLEDGCLKVTTILPAVKHNSEIGKPTWFNSMIAAYQGWKDKRNDPTKAVTFGDGTPLPPEDLQTCSQIMNEICVAFGWKKGDVLMIHNELVMHARNSFVPPRRILACLVA
jgi:alpha-ketoglutarate-dependent taurine dioxygenase